MPLQEIGGATLHYRESGQGLPLVLVHGFPLDQRIWHGQFDELPGAVGCRVITPDLRGFGNSIDTARFTIESLADDLNELLRKIGALPCVLAGLSMGGYVALAYAKKFGATLRGLMLVDTRSQSDTPEGRAGRDAMIALARTKGSSGVADQMFPKMISPRTVQDLPEVARELRAIMEACPAQTIEHALAAMRDRQDYSDFLGTITVPTLVIVGEADQIASPAVARAMHDAIPESKLAIISGAGHMAPIEQPELVNRAVAAFMGQITNRM